MPKLRDLLHGEKVGEIFLLLFFTRFSFCCGFVLFWVFFIVLISFFSFPASGQVQQLLRNCSMSISCVHKCCTVGLTAADPQLPSYRNCFFSLSINSSRAIHPGWSSKVLCGRLIWCLYVCDLLRKCCCSAAWEQSCNPGYQKLLFY